MPTIRRAIVDDAVTIAQQRVMMFQDNGFPCDHTWETLQRDSAKWTAEKLADGSYIGWIAEETAETPASALPKIIGGAGLWIMEFPPHWMHEEPTRGYLLNFYVSPRARGRGLARQFVALAIAECERRGLHLATLHASSMGRPIYENLGWIPSSEMMLRLTVK